MLLTTPDEGFFSDRNEGEVYPGCVGVGGR